MDLIKKSLAVLILLGVVAAAWVGFSIYFKTTEVEVNPNAETYTKQLKTSFDTEYLDDVTQRTGNSFSISPSEFLDLTATEN